MAEVKRQTDAWELHSILSEFDTNQDIINKDSDNQIIGKDTKTKHKNFLDRLYATTVYNDR